MHVLTHAISDKTLITSLHLAKILYPPLFPAAAMRDSDPGQVVHTHVPAPLESEM